MQITYDLNCDGNMGVPSKLRYTKPSTWEAMEPRGGFLPSWYLIDSEEVREVACYIDSVEDIKE